MKTKDRKAPAPQPEESAQPLICLQCLKPITKGNVMGVDFTDDKSGYVHLDCFADFVETIIDITKGEDDAGQ